MEEFKGFWKRRSGMQKQGLFDIKKEERKPCLKCILNSTCFVRIFQLLFERFSLQVNLDISIPISRSFRVHVISPRPLQIHIQQKTLNIKTLIQKLRMCYLRFGCSQINFNLMKKLCKCHRSHIPKNLLPNHSFSWIMVLEKGDLLSKGVYISFPMGLSD